MSRLKDGYFAFVHGWIIAITGLGSVFSLGIALAATLDQLLGLGWGYPWTAIPGGIGMALAIAAFYWIVKRIIDAVRYTTD